MSLDPFGVQGDPTSANKSWWARITRLFRGAAEIMPPAHDEPPLMLPPVRGMATVPGQNLGQATIRYGLDGLERARQAAYSDYDQMDLTAPEIRRALSIVAANATSNDRGDPSFRLVHKPDVDLSIQEMNEDTVSRLGLREMAHPTLRYGKKKGDAFGEPVIDEQGTIVAVIPRAAETMFRVEGEDGRLEGYRQRLPNHTKGIDFPPGGIIHMRCEWEWGDRYGTSMLKGSRFQWKRFNMADDAALVNRLLRATMRYNIDIDMTDMKSAPVEDKKAYIQEMMEINARESLFDKDGNLSLKNRAALDSENYYNPIFTPGVGGVRTLEGSRTVAQITDLRFWHRRMIVVLPVPPSYLGIEDEVNSKSTLSFQDVQFAQYLRHTQQNELRPFFTRIVRLQAALRGIALRPDDVEARFPRVSILDEKVRAETRKLQAEVAQILGTQMGFPIDFIIDEILDLSREVADDLKDYFADEESRMPAPTVPAPVKGPEASKVGNEIYQMIGARREVQLLRMAMTELAASWKADKASPAAS